MSRHFGWALMLAAGVLAGSFLNTQQRTNAEPPATADAKDQENQVLDQLKEINLQLRTLNNMLRWGTARVIPVVNPGR